MTRFNTTIIVTAFLLLFLAINNIQAQEPLSVTVQTEKESDDIQFANRIICAIWMEDVEGNFVKTLALYSKNIHHRAHLVEFNAKNPNYNTVDAYTGATIQRYDTTITVSWNGKDTLNNTLPTGKYVIKCEQTSHNAPWPEWHESYPRPLTADTIDMTIPKTEVLPYVKGFKSRNYTVVVAQSSDATLKDLTLSSGILTPEFHSEVTDYTATVESDIETITISAEANHDSATVNGTGDKSLQYGQNIFQIEVVAQDHSSMTYTITITRLAEGINDVDLSDASIMVFPSPADDILNIKSDGFSEKTMLSIYNMQGQKVMEKLLPPQNNVYSFSIKELPKGVYIVKIQSFSRDFMKKIVIQ